MDLNLSRKSKGQFAAINNSILEARFLDRKRSAWCAEICITGQQRSFAGWFMNDPEVPIVMGFCRSPKIPGCPLFNIIIDNAGELEG
jgi:hypothetical protein